MPKFPFNSEYFFTILHREDCCQPQSSVLCKECCLAWFDFPLLGLEPGLSPVLAS